MLIKKTKIVSAFMAVVMSLQITTVASSNETNSYSKEILTSIGNIENLIKQSKEVDIRMIPNPMEFQCFEISAGAKERFERTNYLAEQELNDRLKKRIKINLLRSFIYPVVCV